jgi:hypothetical protein
VPNFGNAEPVQLFFGQPRKGLVVVNAIVITDRGVIAQLLGYQPHTLGDMWCHQEKTHWLFLGRGNT